VQTGELQEGLIGLRTAVAEKHPPGPGITHQATRQLRLIAVAEQVAGMNQLSGLALNGRHPMRMAMTKGVDRDPRCKIEKLAALVVPDQRTASSHQRKRGTRIVLQNMGVVEVGGTGANDGGLHEK